jgi:hypothetical protein
MLWQGRTPTILLGDEWVTTWLFDLATAEPEPQNGVLLDTCPALDEQVHEASGAHRNGLVDVEIKAQNIEVNWDPVHLVVGLLWA